MVAGGPEIAPEWVAVPWTPSWIRDNVHVIDYVMQHDLMRLTWTPNCINDNLHMIDYPAQHSAARLSRTLNCINNNMDVIDYLMQHYLMQHCLVCPRPCRADGWRG